MCSLGYLLGTGVLLYVREISSHLYLEINHLYSEAVHSFHISRLSTWYMQRFTRPPNEPGMFFFLELVPACLQEALIIKDIWIQE